MFGSVKRVVGSAIRSILRSGGYDLCLAEERRNPFDDMKRLAPRSPLIFDVGANKGQSIAAFRAAFHEPTIHAFEPGRAAFTELERKCINRKNTILNNMALGSRRDTRLFLENQFSDMSSFLETGADGWGDTVSRNNIKIDTVDDYCAARSIKKIDILKSDTQGLDLEVLRGSERMIKEGAIDLIYIELTFAELYKGLPAVDDVLRFLRERRFLPVAFYRSHYRNGRVAWTDALFERK